MSFPGGQSPAPTPVYRTRTLSLSCHSEPVLTLAWESASPRPQARNLQSLPCVKGGVARRATEGLSLPGGTEPRPYTPSTEIPCVIRFGAMWASPPTSVYRASALFFLCHSEGAKRPWESASPVPCLSLWERWPSAARTERANKEGPPPGGPSFSLSINLSCHSEEHPKGTCFAVRSNVGIRNLLVANSQKNVKIVRFWNRLPRQSADWLAMTGFFDSLCQREALTEGLSLPGGAEPRPYTRLPIAFAPSVRADVGIRPYEITGGVCVIRTGGQNPRAPTTVYRQQKHFPNQRPKAATYLCRSAAKARFDNRPPPGGCFQRGRAAALPLWSFKDGGFSRGKEDRNFLPP